MSLTVWLSRCFESCSEKLFSTCKFKFHTIFHTVGGENVISVVTEGLEKVVGINWRTVVVSFVAFPSYSQSFWQKYTLESWSHRGSKWDIFLDKQFQFFSCSYSGCGFANKKFPVLFCVWIFLLFL